ncbi:hypothetical protein [Variovorax sp. UC122_21]|uniref:hypothetical protein n=1 Tax=Variovorax sp. UC122_21 TaxID=3374554 RepID=UPI003756E723
MKEASNCARVVPAATPFLRPVLALERIDAGRDVVVREQQPERRLRREADVGVDPEQVGPFRVGEELRHAVVARPGHEAFALVEQHLHPHAGAFGLDREVHHRHHVVLEELAVVARRDDHGEEALESGGFEHGGSGYRAGRCIRPSSSVLYTSVAAALPGR